MNLSLEQPKYESRDKYSKAVNQTTKNDTLDKSRTLDHSLDIDRELNSRKSISSSRRKLSASLRKPINNTDNNYSTIEPVSQNFVANFKFYQIKQSKKLY